MASVRSTTGLPPGVHVGAARPRLLAAVVEVGPVWLLTALALVFGLGRPVIGIVFGVLALAWAVLVWARRASRAAGIGMRHAHLQIVGYSDGRPIGWGRVLLRWLVFAALTVTVVGLIAMVVAMSRHPRRQGWHDAAVNAVVIQERPLAPPRAGKPAVARATAPVATPAQGVSTDDGSDADVDPAPAPVGASASSASPLATGSAATTGSVETTGSPVGAGSPGSAPDGSAGDVEETDDDPEGADGAEQPAGTAAYEWVLRLDDGRDIGVERLVLLGRNPQPRVGEEDASLIKVSDDTRTVSKSHLAVGVDARGLYVMDRGSTNGTTVTAPDGGARPCPPGDLVDVPAGSVVSFGDHWLEVRRPGA